MTRTLRWRLTRGRRWLDLVEEIDEDGVIGYVGLVNGQEVARSEKATSAGVALVCGSMCTPLPPSPLRT